MIFPQTRWRFLDSATRMVFRFLAITAVASTMTMTTPIPVTVDAFVVLPQVLVFGDVASRGNRHGSAPASIYGPNPLMVRSPLSSSPMEQPSADLWRSSCFFVSKSSHDSGKTDNDNDGNGDNDVNDEKIETLQNQLVYIEALEERNKAQLESFVDEEDQWESMEDYEKELISSKENFEEQLNELLLLSSEGPEGQG